MQTIEECMEYWKSQFLTIAEDDYYYFKLTGEQFNYKEYIYFIQRKLEEFDIEQLKENKKKARRNVGIEPNHKIVNGKSKKPKSKDGYDNGDFNKVYRNQSEDIFKMNLEPFDRLVYYSIREFADFPDNVVRLGDNIPTYPELGKAVDISERRIRDAVTRLENAGLCKVFHIGTKRKIYINPKYYATGNSLSVETLEMFNLLSWDTKKVEDSLKVKEK